MTHKLSIATLFCALAACSAERTPETGVDTTLNESTLPAVDPSKTPSNLTSSSDTGSVRDDAAGASDATLTDPKRIPAIFVGKWGTGKANCADEDDYGPMTISAKGFSQYELSASIVNVAHTPKNNYRLKFTSQDEASEEAYNFSETWQIRSDGALIETTFDSGKQTVTVLHRC